MEHIIIAPHPDDEVIGCGEVLMKNEKTVIVYTDVDVPNERKEEALKLKEHFKNIKAQMFLKSVPKPAEYTISVNKNNTVEYGKYLVTIAACGDCHTPMKMGKFNEKKKLSGGLEMPLPGGSIVRATNLTPDPETGLGMDKRTFIYKFKRFENPNYRSEPIRPGEYNTYMPWRMYAGISEEDLGAIYDYLQTIPPVKNKVVLFSKKK